MRGMEGNEGNLDEHNGMCQIKADEQASASAHARAHKCPRESELQAFARLKARRKLCSRASTRTPFRLITDRRVCASVFTRRQEGAHHERIAASTDRAALKHVRVCKDGHSRMRQCRRVRTDWNVEAHESLARQTCQLQRTVRAVGSSFPLRFCTNVPTVPMYPRTDPQPPPPAPPSTVRA
eukprot:6191126-Pleurochrysis_carterae.AAC.1